MNVVGYVCLAFLGFLFLWFVEWLGRMDREINATKLNFKNKHGRSPTDDEVTALLERARQVKQRRQLEAKLRYFFERDQGREPTTQEVADILKKYYRRFES